MAMQNVAGTSRATPSQGSGTMVMAAPTGRSTMDPYMTTRIVPSGESRRISRPAQAPPMMLPAMPTNMAMNP